MSKIIIACLPVSGKENPYQSLMIEGLNVSDKITAFNGIDNRFFGIIRTGLNTGLTTFILTGFQAIMLEEIYI